MSQEIDYPTELKKILWKRLKRKNEPFDKFEKRIEGRYFSDEVLDYPLLLQIINDSNNSDFDDAFFSDTLFTRILYNANYLFLKVFKSRAKSRLNQIIGKVNEIIGIHDDSHNFKSVIIFILLSIFYQEKWLKQYARWINSEVSAEIQQTIEKELGSFLLSLSDLRKVFYEEELSPKKAYSQEAYREKITNPVKEKAMELGLSDKLLLELAKFIADHKNNKIAEFKDAKYTDAYAKRDQDYSALSRSNLQLLFNLLKNEIGIPPEQALRHMADLVDLFEIRRINDIMDEFDAKKEKLSYADARDVFAKRISDVIHKPR